MFKLRNLLAVGMAIVVLLAVMIPLAGAQPAQQATDTPEPTAATTATSVAPAVSPLATPSAAAGSGAVSTPSTLPTTGGSDDSAVMLSLTAIVLGVAVLLGAFSLAMSRRRTR